MSTKYGVQIEVPGQTPFQSIFGSDNIEDCFAFARTLIYHPAVSNVQTVTRGGAWGVKAVTVPGLRTQYISVTDADRTYDFQ